MSDGKRLRLAVAHLTSKGNCQRSFGVGDGRDLQGRVQRTDEFLIDFNTRQTIIIGINPKCLTQNSRRNKKPVRCNDF